MTVLLIICALLNLIGSIYTFYKSMKSNNIVDVLGYGCIACFMLTQIVHVVNMIKR